MIAALVLALSQDDAPAVAGVPYHARATRAETRSAMLDLLTPERGQWGSFWLATPFPFAGFGTGDLATPHAPEEELAAYAANGPGPDLSRVMTGRAGREVRWQELGPVANQRIDLAIFEDAALNENGVAYVYTTVRSDEARTVEIPMGSDDGLRLWCNGELVLERDVARSLDPHADLVTLHLEAGVNHLLFKVSQGVGGWDLQVMTRAPLSDRAAAELEYRLDLDFPDSAESADYQVFTIPASPGVVLEVGGLDVLPDGRPIACTRRGEVWIVEGAYDEPPLDAHFIRYAAGLHEPLGLAVRVEHGRTVVYCAQRPELTRLSDRDGDDRADLFETVCDGWGLSGNYHEFAFGPKFDRQGNAWVTLNVGFCGSLGKSTVPWRGWAVKVTPDGRMVPVCDGLRSPNGIGMWTDGEMFYADNQGDWVATCRITHLAPGSWAGHPASLRWRGDLAEGQRPERIPAAVWLPYGRMGQSTADLVLDTTGGAFGPFDGQFFCGDQTRASVMRVTLEKVGELYQGACYPFLEGLDSGVNRLAFAPDGSLLVGETDRGWGSVGPRRQGLQRIRWRGTVPFEIREVRAHAGGFDVELTGAVDAAALEPAAWTVTSHTYEHHADYGAPEIDRATHEVRCVLPLDERSVRLFVTGLRPGYVHEVRAGEAVRERATGRSLVHPAAWYTLQRVPDPGPGPSDCP